MPAVGRGEGGEEVDDGGEWYSDGNRLTMSSQSISMRAAMAYLEDIPCGIGYIWSGGPEDRITKMTSGGRLEHLNLLLDPAEDMPRRTKRHPADSILHFQLVAWCQ